MPHAWQVEGGQERKELPECVYSEIFQMTTEGSSFRNSKRLYTVLCTRGEEKLCNFQARRHAACVVVAFGCIDTFGCRVQSFSPSQDLLEYWIPSAEFSCAEVIFPIVQQSHSGMMKLDD